MIDFVNKVFKGNFDWGGFVGSLIGVIGAILLSRYSYMRDKKEQLMKSQINILQQVLEISDNIKISINRMRRLKGQEHQPAFIGELTDIDKRIEELDKILMFYPEHKRITIFEKILFKRNLFIKTNEVLMQFYFGLMISNNLKYYRKNKRDEFYGVLDTFDNNLRLFNRSIDSIILTNKTFLTGINFNEYCYYSYQSKENTKKIKEFMKKTG
ncbi:MULTISPECIES: hypothetical protein [Peptoniphilus]|uniref:hypothetical protein n=1 Tax=Peptoniphilus TaxID=162289 RepID=UPI002911433F|nr:MULTISPECIES: hypothetical protein [Peptoniphilus]MDU5274379.1 hypothetical protein [Peptoniphilus lacydonensis]MDU5594452.1 hypothetical protein [Peptoniphilus rhinitidis]